MRWRTGTLEECQELIADIENYLTNGTPEKKIMVYATPTKTATGYAVPILDELVPVFGGSNETPEWEEPDEII